MDDDWREPGSALKHGIAIHEKVDRQFRYIDRTYSRLLKAMYDDDLGHVHIERSGKQTPLYNLETRHLMNIMSMHAHNLAEGINECGKMAGPESMLDAIMDGATKKTENLENAKNYIAEGYAILGRYTVEALRRGQHFNAMDAIKPYTDAVSALHNVDIERKPIQRIIIKETIDEQD
jgi:hypothetical protein